MFILELIDLIKVEVRIYTSRWIWKELWDEAYSDGWYCLPCVFLFVSVYCEENKLMNSRVNMDIEVDMCCDRHGKLMFRIHFKWDPVLRSVYSCQPSAAAPLRSNITQVGNTLTKLLPINKHCITLRAESSFLTATPLKISPVTGLLIVLAQTFSDLQLRGGSLF